MDVSLTFGEQKAIVRRHVATWAASELPAGETLLAPRHQRLGVACFLLALILSPLVYDLLRWLVGA